MRSRWNVALASGVAGALLAAAGSGLALDSFPVLGEGDDILASDFNDRFTALTDAITALENAQAPVESAIARCHLSNDQAVPTSTNIRPNFDQCEIDTMSAVTTGVNWVFVAPRDGLYRVDANVTYSVAAWGAHSHDMRLFVDGVVNSLSLNALGVTSAAGYAESGSIADILSLKKGQEVYLEIWHNGPDGVTLQGFVDRTRILIQELR